ncbi:MAG: RNA polymerase factor sigma-54 [Muribaculaceae bacterium]|nr:RNA polymerase factor sigma-54 [Muribaculaceae bacterium]
MAGKTALSQEQKLTQRLSVLQMQLSPMIEMSNNELEERVERELDDNPALEKAEDPTEGELDKTQDGDEYTETSDQLQAADYASDDEIPSYRLRANNSSADDEYQGPVAVAEETLSDKLLEQIREREMSERDYTIAEYIVGNLDDDGRLPRSAAAIADDITFNRGVTVEADEVQQMIEVVQSLDPAGIAARDLQECLLLQLRRKPDDEPHRLATEIVANHFQDFAQHRYEELCDDLGISRASLREARECITKLDPKPGRAYSSSTLADYGNKITPDFIVEVDGDTLTLTLPSSIPALQISESYQIINDYYTSHQPQNKQQAAEAAVARQQYDSAASFIRLIKMRQETLFRTMRSIMDHQRQFFITGDESAMVPLTLKDVASDTGNDTSVVSRATTNKYVSTPWGTYSLKHFFNEGITTSDGETVSTKQTKNLIGEIVAAEDKRRPLSDEQIRIKLKSQGHDISRRTVSKYREQLSIPKAGLRKELK